MVNTKRTKFNVSGIGIIKSIKEMSELSGRSEQIIRYRLNLGASDDDIFYSDRFSVCLFNGEYIKIYKLLKKYNVEYCRFRYLLSRGATVKQALNIDELGGFFKKHTLGTPITVKGIEYTSIKKAYDDFKDEVEISYNTVKQRYIEYKWTGDEALFLNKNVKLNLQKRKERDNML